MNKPNSLARAFLYSPFLWGAAICFGFYWLVSMGLISGQYIESYFTSHPVEYAAAAMFFVGLAALAIKIVDVNVQHQRLEDSLLGPIPEGGQVVDDCRLLATRLDRISANQQADYLIVRLRNAIEYVRRSGSAKGLDEELRYLADTDAGKVYSSYGLVRMIVWAIPVLGFLGTVIGIAMAIGELSPDALETSLPTVMNSLAVAFNTTTQALGLSIVLMFAMFLTERKENSLLSEVDTQVEEEMIGRFRREVNRDDGQLGVVRQMLESVIAGTETLVRRQAELWQSTMDAAAGRWSGMTATAGKQLESALTASLGRTLEQHALTLVANEERFADANRKNWQQLQETLVNSSRTLVTLNEAVREEAELLGRAVDAAGHITSLEAALNSNLEALAGSKNFEETVMSLAAAIHLLNNRLGSPAQTPKVQLEPNRKPGQAA